MTAPRIVVDTSALIAMMNGEPDEAWLAGELAAAPERLMSAGSVQEFLIVASSRASSTAALADAWALLDRFEITVVPVSGELALLGAAGVSHVRPPPARLNYGDGFAYALAKAYDCPVLCKGDDFVHTDIDVVRPD